MRHASGNYFTPRVYHGWDTLFAFCEVLAEKERVAGGGVRWLCGAAAQPSLADEGSCATDRARQAGQAQNSSEPGVNSDQAA